MNKFKLLSIILFSILICVILFFTLKENTKADTTRINHAMVINNIEQLGKLELVRYNVQNIVEYKKLRNWLPNAKTLLVAVGEVVACIDLSSIKSEDIYYYKDSINIILPLPEICHYKINHQKSKIYQVDYGFWETSNLVDEAYKYAEEQLYLEIKKSNYQQDAQINAYKVLKPLLNGMGFEKITLTFKQKENETFFENYKPNINY